MLRIKESKAMTVLEVVVTLVVIGILAGFSVLSFNAVRDRTSDRGSTVELSIVQTAARQISSYNNQTYPDDINQRLNVPRVRIVSGTTPSSVKEEVSVYKIDDRNLMLAAKGGDLSCIFVLESLDKATVWGIDSNLASPLKCTGNNAQRFRNQITSRVAEAPTALNIN